MRKVAPQAPSQAPRKSALKGATLRISAASIAARRADKASSPARRHLLTDVLDVYVSQMTDSDPGRLYTLQMWRDTLGHRLIDEITGDEVAEVLEAYAEQPVLRFVGKDTSTGERLYRNCGSRAPATVNRAKSVLGSVFNFAKAHKLLPASHHAPTRSIPGLKVKNVEDRSLSEDEVGRLLAWARTAPWPRMYLFTLMALTTGARRGELLQLRGCDLNLNAEVPTATARLTKNGEVKVMPLTPAVVAQICKLGLPQPQAHLFPSLRRENQPFEISASFRALLERAGLKHKRMHDLRHTCGSTLAREGRSDSEIAAVLGHKTLQVVKRYAHVNTRAKAGILQSSALSSLR